MNKFIKKIILLTSLLFVSAKNNTIEFAQTYASSEEIVNDDEGYNYFISNSLWQNTSFQNPIEQYLDKIKNSNNQDDTLRITHSLNEMYRVAYEVWKLETFNGKDQNNRETEASCKAVLYATVVWFNNNSYYLASELLVHFLSHSSPDSPGVYYTPSYGNLIAYSSASRTVALGNTVNGGNIFNANTPVYGITSSQNNRIMGDLYYSIKNFSYTKDYASSRTFTLYDLYDFSPSNSGEYNDYESTAINAAYWLQTNGYCYPFNIKQVCTPPIQIINCSFYDDYFSRFADIKQNNPMAIVVYSSSSLGFLTMTQGSISVSIEMYLWGNDQYINSYTGGGIGNNTSFYLNMSSNYYYYIKIQTNNISTSLTYITFIQSYQTSLNVSSQYTINNAGTFYGHVGMCDVNIYRVNLTTGTHNFYINNGYDEYAYRMCLLNPITCSIVGCTIEYEPTYSSLTTYISTSYTYLLLVMYEDFTDGGLNYSLLVS